MKYEIRNQSLSISLTNKKIINDSENNVKRNLMSNDTLQYSKAKKTSDVYIIFVKKAKQYFISFVFNNIVGIKKIIVAMPKKINLTINYLFC